MLGKLSWRKASIPQVPIPMTIRGHEYLLEIDEFANFSFTDPDGVYQPDAPVGAARIINIDDELHPRVVSNIRLQVNQPKARRGPARNDPGAQPPVQGYAGHSCSVPRRVDPTIVACSFIASGLRLFDVRDPHHPKEVGYYNKAAGSGRTPRQEWWLRDVRPRVGHQAETGLVHRRQHRFPRPQAHERDRLALVTPGGGRPRLDA